MKEKRVSSYSSSVPIGTSKLYTFWFHNTQDIVILVISMLSLCKSLLNYKLVYE